MKKLAFPYAVISHCIYVVAFLFIDYLYIWGMADNITPQPGTEAANPQDALKVDASKTTFGFASVSLPTPKWANSAFDIYLIITTSFLAWIVADSVFDKEFTQHVFYFLTLFLTPVIKGISKMFGVAVDQK